MAGSEQQPPDLEEEDYTLKIKDIFGEVIYQAFLGKFYTEVYTVSAVSRGQCDFGKSGKAAHMHIL